VHFAGDFQEWSEDNSLSAVYSFPSTEYRAGRTYHERWNTGVFGPALPPAGFAWDGVTRAGDAIVADVPLFSDGAGRFGDNLASSLTVALIRDGKKIALTDGSFDVPPDEAPYRLEIHAERAAPIALSTKIDIAWTFRSGHVAGATPVALPLWSIRFTPELDKYNTAPANHRLAVPMLVTPQPDARVGTLVRRTVEASFDDGATWIPVQLKDDTALIANPAGSGFVSLKASAADSEGNTVEQTIIHAYRYSPTQ
jgi:hypothetical protein